MKVGIRAYTDLILETLSMKRQYLKEFDLEHLIGSLSDNNIIRLIEKGRRRLPFLTF